MTEEPLELLSPLDLCTNLVNQKIGHYRVSVLMERQDQGECFDAIVAEARKHRAVWEEYVKRIGLKKDAFLNDLLRRVTEKL